MARKPKRKTRRRGRKKRGAARPLIVLAALVLVVAIGGQWLRQNPQHNPLAPLDLRDPIGMATATKLVALRSDVPECRAVLDRSRVAYTALTPIGEGNCARPDRTKLDDFPLTPGIPATTCPVAAALELWRARSIEPAAREILGSPLARMEHMGVYNCRRIRGTRSNAWSEHATGNAIDIGAFVLEDGTRISVLRHWQGDSPKARFLRRVRDDACSVFATVLSPDYNAAHADHFHLDQNIRLTGVCR